MVHRYSFTELFSVPASSPSGGWYLLCFETQLYYRHQSGPSSGLRAFRRLQLRVMELLF